MVSESQSALHLLFLYVLTFQMKSILVGGWHYLVASTLTLLMGAIVILFVVDMLSAARESWKVSKAVDGIVGFVWFSIVGFLFLRSWHTGMW